MHMLRECVDSVLAQTRAIDQIMVVNDGSTDDTEAVVRSYGDRIVLINKENGGKASALNLALAQCTSDYVWICDDDDIAAPDGIEHLATALDSDDILDCAFGICVWFHDENGKRIYSNPASIARNGETNLKILLLEEMLTSLNAMLVRRTSYAKAGPFREDLIRSQDYDMLIKLMRNAKIKYVPKPVYYLRQHEGIRGATADAFSAKENTRKWQEYDRKIFSWVRQEFLLEEFTPTFALGWGHAATKRAAMTQRACIFARREMWKDAIDDFIEAEKLCSRPATPEELQLAEHVVVRTVLFPKTAVFTDPEWIEGMHACFRANRYSRSIIIAGCRPFVWRARVMFQSGNLAGGIRIMRALVGILGIKGTCSRLLSSILR